nr:uncharacterized protein LOC133602971 [Nerophis lumbriciformis]
MTFYEVPPKPVTGTEPPMPSKPPEVDALNQDFSRFDQVHKPQTYHLAGDQGEELYDEEFEIRTCDRSLLGRGREGREQFGHDLGQTMEEIGFAILTGHGVDPALWGAAYAATEQTLTEVPLADRLRYRAERFGSVSQGYFPIGQTSDIHPDQVEGWVFCRRAFDLGEDPSYDPAAFRPRPEHEPIFRRVAEAHQRLILPLTRSMLRYLGCEPGLFDERLTDTNFGLRLNYYQPLGDEPATGGAGRLLGHEDVDLFTILPAPEVEGLQVLNRRNNRWIRLQAPPGSIILNTGDYLQRLTKDRLPSTTHRVGKPRDPAHCNRPRMSIPMAVYLWEDELLEVLPGLGEPKYEPVKAITFHTRATAKFYGEDYAVE